MSTYQWHINTGGHGANDASHQWNSTPQSHTVHPSWGQPVPSSSPGIQPESNSWTRSFSEQAAWSSPQTATAPQPECSSCNAFPSWGASTSVTFSNFPVQQHFVQITSPSPMAYPVYQSSPSAPGPQDGTLYPSRGNGWGGGNSGGSGGIRAHGASGPVQIVHQAPTGATSYYCRELNGSWKVRTTSDIMNNCQPGTWRSHSQTGYPFFERRAAD